MPLGIYVHIPFCARRCDYCDFFVVVGGGSPGEFFERLNDDIDLCAAALQATGSLVDTIYFGGGTPSSVDPAEVARLLDRFGRRFHLGSDPEITLEANPESVTPQSAAAWRAAGVNRLSLGVQSFNDSVLPRRGRLYDAAGACAAVRVARGSGFDNVSVDLIAGLPGETSSSFLAGIARLVDMAPDHASVYLLETDDALKQTPLTLALREGRERLPDEEATVTMYTGAVERLVGAGYHHYEISNFAQPGRESRHNLKYWRSEEYCGVGPSAHSCLGGRRFGRPADMAGWIQEIREGLFAPLKDDYTLEEASARAREALVLSLRLIDGVDLVEFARRWDFDPAVELSREIDDLRREGLLASRGASLSLTPRGVLLSNEVFARIH
ncbi:MAG TPA: radical SAM family heme chaperone HemW [Patescibacteria group bacterium]|nr:radical SAM family heme chaperone HemW [Patescibacteria group bacterium]